MHQQTLKSLMLAMGEVFSREVTPALVGLYWAVLRTYDDESVKRAVEFGMRTWKFFPKPSEIVEAMEGDAEKRAFVAYLMFQRAKREVGGERSVMFSDPYVAETVRVMGGWSHDGVFSWTPESELRNMERFIETYKVLRASGIEPEGDTLVSIHDMRSSRRFVNGEWVRVEPKPVMVTFDGKRVVVGGSQAIVSKGCGADDLSAVRPAG